MAKKIDYASLYTLRRDGRYCKRLPNGKYIYDKDPYQLYLKEQEAMRPKANTLKDVAEHWEDVYRQTVTDGTWKNLKPHYKDIVAAYGDYEIAELDGMDVNNDLLKMSAKGFSHSVVNSRRVIWNGIFNYALANGLIRANPAANLKLPKGLKKGTRRATTREEDKIICSNIDKTFGFFPYFLLCTGMRRSEALALLKSDIDFRRGFIIVDKTLTNVHNQKPGTKAPKTEAGNRSVPIAEALEAPLKSYMKSFDSVYLFPAINHKLAKPDYIKDRYMNESNFAVSWKNYCQEVGFWDYVEDKALVTPHMLRHSVATMMFEDGVDEFTAKTILGHASINITREIYTELRKEQEAKSNRKFGKSMKRIMQK